MKALTLLALVAGSASSSLGIDVLDFEYRDAASGTPVTLAAPGSQVEWRIVQGMHSVRDVAGAFASGILLEGESFAFRVEGPGAYSYYCELHEWMRGLVVVAP